MIDDGPDFRYISLINFLSCQDQKQNSNGHRKNASTGPCIDIETLFLFHFALISYK